MPFGLEAEESRFRRLAAKKEEFEDYRHGSEGKGANNRNPLEILSLTLMRVSGSGAGEKKQEPETKIEVEGPSIPQL